MRKTIISAVLVSLAIAACSDVRHPSAPIQRADVPQASVVDVVFYFNANSYGPNGEVMVPQSCQGTYNFNTYNDGPFQQYWVDAQGNPHTENIYFRRVEYERVGCVPQEGYSGPYNGGGTSITYGIGGASVGLGFIAADGTENSETYKTPSNAPANVNFFSAANANCSFLYYDVWGGSGYIGRYTNNSLDWPSNSIDNHVFNAVFQCNSSYDPG